LVERRDNNREHYSGECSSERILTEQSKIDGIAWGAHMNDPVITFPNVVKLNTANTSSPRRIAIARVALATIDVCTL
jgi:hypothetical protein